MLNSDYLKGLAVPLHPLRLLLHFTYLKVKVGQQEELDFMTTDGRFGWAGSG